MSRSVARASFNDSPFPAGSPVVLYLRHSPGDQQTLVSQESAVREWCDENHLAILRVYRDQAKSGTTTAGRDDFLAMVDALRDGVILRRPAGVVVWALDRFGRDYDASQFYMGQLRHLGYVVHSMTDDIPEGPIGRFVESYIHMMNEDRTRRIGRDAQRGL
jgi:site-specific DNA recombinase